MDPRLTIQAFSEPRKVLRWAGEEIEQFEAVEKNFLDAHPGKEWSHLDFPTGQMVHGITFSQKPTENLEKSAYRIVSDLRNAMDQAVYAASKSLSVPNLKHTTFPIGDSRNDFERRLASSNGSYRDIPVELHPVLTSLEPWWRPENGGDGNNLLRGLAEMANPNKHQVPLGTEVQTGMKFFGAKGAIIGFGTKWDWQGKTELYRTVYGEPFEINIELEPRIAFGKIGRLGGKPATRTFQEMESLVKNIVSSLEAAATTILES